ncbi:UNKNOWN [Stylonychia lemnae]|uniref:Uncharacterized protein n=1 Tax=Stylonychia lemnae TaxID=5949 RepID=A0A077ZQL2_STYLE|nr:UNKNOWN [Stylonychia lemnae]|eukprot:CDW71670.1 UNKNOWN [Stylonychia lemnae]
MIISKCDIVSHNLINQEGSKLLVNEISSLRIMKQFINKGLAQSSQGDKWIINDFLNENDFVTEHGIYEIQELKNIGTITLLGSTWNLSKVNKLITQPDFIPIQSFKQEGKIECSDDIIINDQTIPMELRTLKNVKDYRWRDLCITPEQINIAINNIEYGGSYIIYAKKIEIPQEIIFETQKSIVLEVQELANYGQWVLFKNLNLRLVKMINGLDNNRQATLQVNGKLTIDAQTIDNRFGVIASNDTLCIKSEELLNGALMHQQRAPLFPNGNINSSYGGSRYQESAYQHCYLNGSGIISTSDLHIECKQIKNEYGEIMTQGNLTIQGDMLYNLCGNVYSSKSINANVKEIKLDRAGQRIFPAYGFGHYHNLKYRLECSDPPTLSSLVGINLVCQQLINNLGVISAGQNITFNNREYSGINSGVINHSRLQWYDENNYVTGEYHCHDHRVPATNSVIISGSKIQIASSLFEFEGGTAAAPVIKIKAQNIIVNQNKFNSHADRDQQIVINLYEAAKSMTGGLIKEDLTTGVIQCPHIKSKSSLDLDKLNIQTLRNEKAFKEAVEQYPLEMVLQKVLTGMNSLNYEGLSGQDLPEQMQIAWFSQHIRSTLNQSLMVPYLAIPQKFQTKFQFGIIASKSLKATAEENVMLKNSRIILEKRDTALSNNVQDRKEIKLQIRAGKYLVRQSEKYNAKYYTPDTIEEVIACQNTILLEHGNGYLEGKEGIFQKATLTQANEGSLHFKSQNGGITSIPESLDYRHISSHKKSSGLFGSKNLAKIEFQRRYKRDEIKANLQITLNSAGTQSFEAPFIEAVGKVSFKGQSRSLGPICISKKDDIEMIFDSIKLVNPKIQGEQIVMDAKEGVEILQGRNYNWSNYQSFMINAFQVRSFRSSESHLTYSAPQINGNILSESQFKIQIIKNLERQLPFLKQLKDEQIEKIFIEEEHNYEQSLHTSLGPGVVAIGMLASSLFLAPFFDTFAGSLLNTKYYLNNSLKYFDFMKISLVETTISSAVNLAKGQDIEHVLKDGVLQFLASVASSQLTSQIGKQYSDNKIDYFQHKALHGFVGLGVGAILNPKNPVQGALSGLVGAVSAEIFSEAIKDFELSEIDDFDEMYYQKIQAIAEKSQTYGVFLGALSTLFLGMDVDIGAYQAQKAVENNFLHTLIAVASKIMLIYNSAVFAQTLYESYKENGLIGAMRVIGIEIVQNAIGRFVMRPINALGKQLFRILKFQKILNNLKEDLFYLLSKSKFGTYFMKKIQGAMQYATQKADQNLLKNGQQKNNKRNYQYEEEKKILSEKRRDIKAKNKTQAWRENQQQQFDNLDNVEKQKEEFSRLAENNPFMHALSLQSIYPGAIIKSNIPSMGFDKKRAAPNIHQQNSSLTKIIAGKQVTMRFDKYANPRMDEHSFIYQPITKHEHQQMAQNILNNSKLKTQYQRIERLKTLEIKEVNDKTILLFTKDPQNYSYLQKFYNERWNEKTQSTKYILQKGFTWHHDFQTNGLYLVPTDIHKGFGHKAINQRPMLDILKLLE